MPCSGADNGSLARWRMVSVGALVACLLALAGCDSPRAGPQVTLTCVGDVMIARGVAAAQKQHGPPYPFEQVSRELRRGELTFGNLECPLTDRDTRFPRVNALRAPPEMAQVLVDVGFDVVSLANNHAIDYGRAGLEQTLSVLAEAGITPVGAGRTLQEALAGCVVTVRGVRVGFLAFSNFPYAGFVCDPDRPSIAFLSREALEQAIPRLATHCDLLVVSFHWGREGEAWTSEFERETAHLAVDLGADLVVGHHAHVRGEIEQYRGALIAYCLGNLVFDEDSYGGNEGFILRCSATGEGIEEYAALPVEVVGCQARLLSPRP